MSYKSYKMEGEVFSSKEEWLTYCVTHVGKAMERAARDHAYEQHPLQPTKSEILATEELKRVKDLTKDEAVELVQTPDFRRRLPITPNLDQRRQASEAKYFRKRLPVAPSLNPRRRSVNEDEFFQTMSQKMLNELAQSYWMLVSDWPMD